MEGSKAYQVDDLVVAGRQDIAAVVMKGLVWLSVDGVERVPARQHTTLSKSYE